MPPASLKLRYPRAPEDGVVRCSDNSCITFITTLSAIITLLADACDYIECHPALRASKEASTVRDDICSMIVKGGNSLADRFNAVGSTSNRGVASDMNFLEESKTPGSSIVRPQPT